MPQTSPMNWVILSTSYLWTMNMLMVKTQMKKTTSNNFKAMKKMKINWEW